MLHFSKFFVLLCLTATTAFAQSETALQLGVPNDTVFVNPSAFTEIRQWDGDIHLTAHPGFLPVIQDYARLAPPEGISVLLCGVELPSIEVTPETQAGSFVIPTGNVDLAVQGVMVFWGASSCEAFTDFANSQAN